MRRGSRAAVGLAVSAVALAAGAAPSFAADRDMRDRVIAVEGVSRHDPGLRVEILVHVDAGTSARNAADRALEAQGAKRKPEPPQSSAYEFNGLRWDVLPVEQNYNPSGQPTSAAQTALTNTHGAWSSVSGSTYRITFGGTTSRCPSLVKECPGRQLFDGNNDVGWAGLSGNTLGVTWYSTSIDEADMAMNTRFAWSTGCVQQPNRIDMQTVFLHENGHVAGLDHSSSTSAVMYPSYQTARCTLAADDRAGIAALY
jgi:Matrixin